MPIKNLTNARRLPRLGKIRLGIKKTASSGKEYPAEVDYFVVPDKIKSAVGDKPKELHIMFPVDNDEVFFQQWLKHYGAVGLKCKGDGETANILDPGLDPGAGVFKSVPCPCEKLKTGECKPLATLLFMMPDVDGVGVWQIDTSSKNSIIDVNSSIDFIRRVAGRINMIPLILKREERTMTRMEDGKQKKSTHYTMKINVDKNFTMGQLQEAAQIKPEVVCLPPPDETKDDLLYPENGFKPEGTPAGEDKYVHGAKTGSSTIDELPGGEEEPEISDEAKRIAVLRDELTGVIAECEGTGLKMTKQAWVQVHALKEEAEYKKAIETFRGKLGKKSAKKETELF